MLASVPDRADPVRLPSTRELVLAAARLTVTADPGIAGRSDRRPVTRIVVRAVSNAARAIRAVGRLRGDPVVPTILAGGYYVHPGAARELAGMVERLVHALSGGAGLAWQEAGIDALRLGHRHAGPYNQLVTAAHVLDLLGAPIP